MERSSGSVCTGKGTCKGRVTTGAVTGRRRCGRRRSSRAWIRSSIGGVLESEGVIEGGDLGGDGGLLMLLHLWWSRWCFLLNLLWHLE